MQHNYKNPIYEFSIDSRECAVELKVNDFPCFSTYEKGDVALDWPVNANILSRGNQFYTLSIIPYEDENFINRKAIVKAKISVRDAFDASQPRTLIAELQIPDFSKEEMKRTDFVSAGDFDASVPYDHLGWKNSINLLSDDKDLLFKEIEKFYIDLFKIFKTRNIEKYRNLNNVRFQELCSSFYLTPPEMKRREVSFIPKFKGSIEMISPENYRFIFLGGGKLVAFRIPNEPIGLKFISDDETDNIIYEQAIFHRATAGTSLSLIR